MNALTPIAGVSTRPISIAVLAMGGQGGGVLMDWIVALAESQGFIAQSTSVPGVGETTASRSTTKTNGSLGLITPPAPRAPYASADGIVSFRRPPTRMPWTPWSQPAITWPLPSLNSNGRPRSHEASNSSPVEKATPT